MTLLGQNKNVKLNKTYVIFGRIADNNVTIRKSCLVVHSLVRVYFQHNITPPDQVAVEVFTTECVTRSILLRVLHTF